MNSRVRTKIFFDKIANEYDKWNIPFSRELNEFVYQIIENAKPKTLLDLGCGTGSLLYKLVSSNVRLYGIDISKRMVEVARKKIGKHAKITHLTEIKLPFFNSSISAISAIEMFHHVDDPRFLLTEIYRVLENNGFLVIGEIHYSYFNRLFRNIFLPDKYGNYKYYSKTLLIQLLKENGFKKINIHSAPDKRFLITCKKVEI